jgi:hypothetical protein
MPEEESSPFLKKRTKKLLFDSGNRDPTAAPFSGFASSQNHVTLRHA